MPTATQIVKQLFLDWSSGLMWKTGDRYSAEDVKYYMEELVLDWPEAYDEDWYALIATPAIKATINWQDIADAENKIREEHELEELKEKINQQELECLCAMR